MLLELALDDLSAVEALASLRQEAAWEGLPLVNQLAEQHEEGLLYGDPPPVLLLGSVDGRR